MIFNNNKHTNKINVHNLTYYNYTSKIIKKNYQNLGRGNNNFNNIKNNTNIKVKKSSKKRNK